MHEVEVGVDKRIQALLVSGSYLAKEVRLGILLR